MATYYANASADPGGDGTTQALTGANCAFNTVSAAQTALTGDQSDNSLLFNRGDLWRELFTLGMNGTAGHQFSIGAYGSGALPKIYGSTQVSTFTDEGGNLWYATCTADPKSVWFVNTNATIVWGEKQTAKGNLNAEYEWWWDDPNDRLYVYATSDPDSRYTSIEKPTRDYCVYSLNHANVTVSNLDCSFCNVTDADGYAGIELRRANGSIIENCVCHHIGIKNVSPNMRGGGIWMENSNAFAIRNNITYECGRRGIVMFLNNNSITMDNGIVEHNISYNNGHSGIDVFRQINTGTFDNLTIRYNLIFANSDRWQGWGSFGPDADMTGIAVSGPRATSDYRLTNVKIHNNIVHHMYGSGSISVFQNVDGAEVYNNTCYGALTNTLTWGAGIHTGIDHVLNVKIKNNLCVDIGINNGACLYVEDAASVIECENNCWYQSQGGTYAYTSIGGTDYHSNDQAAYKTATGWDDTGLWEDPLFIAPASNNFHLNPSSPCVDAGVAVGLSTDFEGKPIVGLPDMGALELGRVWLFGAHR